MFIQAYRRTRSRSASSSSLRVTKTHNDPSTGGRKRDILVTRVLATKWRLRKTNPDGDEQEVGEEDVDLSSPSPDLDRELFCRFPPSLLLLPAQGKWWWWLLLGLIPSRCDDDDEVVVAIALYAARCCDGCPRRIFASGPLIFSFSRASRSLAGPKVTCGQV